MVVQIVPCRVFHQEKNRSSPIHANKSSRSLLSTSSLVPPSSISVQPKCNCGGIGGYWQHMLGAVKVCQPTSDSRKSPKKTRGFLLHSHGWEFRPYPAGFLRKMSNIAQISTGWKWGKSLFYSLKLKGIFSLEPRSDGFMKRNCWCNYGGPSKGDPRKVLAPSPMAPRWLANQQPFTWAVALQPGWWLRPQRENFW